MDMEGSFEPLLIPKVVRRLDGFDEKKIISMYARGMSVREIQDYVYEIYEMEVSHDLISSITDQVINLATEWQNRPLDELYPILYLDCIHVKARDNDIIINKSCLYSFGY